MAIPALFDGEQTPEAWEKRKEDILQLFREYEYGITPDIKLDKVAYTNILEDIDLYIESRQPVRI